MKRGIPSRDSRVTGGTIQDRWERGELIGKLYGDEVFVSTECGTTTNTSGSTNFRAILYIHKGAFALAEQMAPRAQTQYDAEFLGTIFVVDSIYGTAELRNDGGVAIIVPS